MDNSIHNAFGGGSTGEGTISIAAAIEHLTSGVAILDHHGTFIKINKTLEKLIGYKSLELHEKRVQDLVVSDDSQKLQDKLWSLKTGLHSSFNFKCRFKDKEGKEVPLEVDGVFVKDKNVHDYFVLNVFDISEQTAKEDDFKKQQQQIQDAYIALEAEADKIAMAQSRMRALLENVGDGIIVTDQDGVITLSNPAAVNMLDLKEEDIVGKSISEVAKVVDENGKPIPLYKRPSVVALSTGQKFESSIRDNYFYEKKNGDRFAVGITVTPFVLNNKIIGTIVVFRDITLEKQIDQAKTEFVSLASHQLRTPLTSIGWYAEMLQDEDAGKLNDDQKDYLAQIQAGNTRMVKLVNSLLNVSRIELGTFSVEPQPTKLTELSDSVLDELTPTVQKKKLKIEKKYDPELPTFNVDPQLLRIVFQNLLSNAVKYTPDEGMVTVVISLKDTVVQIQVKDSGYGIPKDEQKEIFSKLFRASNVKAKEVEGTGLGLYIVQSIVEQSGGKIWFESEEDKGTIFFVELPKEGMKKKEGSRKLEDMK